MLSLLPIMMGLALTSAYDLSFNITGFLAALCNNLTDWYALSSNQTLRWDSSILAKNIHLNDYKSISMAYGGVSQMLLLPQRCKAKIFPFKLLFMLKIQES